MSNVAFKVIRGCLAKDISVKSSYCHEPLVYMSYQNDLSKAEWYLIKHNFYPHTKRGNASKHARKKIVDAILYVLKGGITWRMLPNDLPPWKTVYDHFSKWNKQGVWEKALDEANQWHRRKAGKKTNPSYGIIDAQSVKTQYASEDRGIDGGKKVKGVNVILLLILWGVYCIPAYMLQTKAIQNPLVPLMPGKIFVYSSLFR